MSSSLGEVESLVSGNRTEESVDQCLKLQYQLNAYESKSESVNTEKDQLTVEVCVVFSFRNQLWSELLICLLWNLFILLLVTI